MENHITVTRTFLADVSVLNDDEIYRRIYAKVPDFRRKKADKLKFRQDKNLSIGAWYLYMLGLEKCGNPQKHSFNLSHSGRYALCSIGPESEETGCDVEMTGEFHRKLAQRFFCSREYQCIMDEETEEKRSDRYYRYWVLKESFMKATRKGMALGMNEFEISFDREEDKPFLSGKPEEFKRSYYFHEYSCPGAKIAVCSTGNRFSDEVEVLEYLK